MKNIKLFLLLVALLPLSGCAVGQVFWVSQTTLDSEQFGQMIRLGLIRSEIDAKVEVFLGDGHIYPLQGIGSGSFVSHRATFWRLDPKEPSKYKRTYGEVLQPFGRQPVRVSSTLLAHRLKIRYYWQDRFGKEHRREILVPIYPGSETDTLPQFEIVLVENPGRDPIRDH